MRQSREAKAESHRTIVAKAAKMFRERGIEGTSVADVMGAAHMTHGGFCLARARPPIEPWATSYADGRVSQNTWRLTVMVEGRRWCKDDVIPCPGMATSGALPTSPSMGGQVRTCGR